MKPTFSCRRSDIAIGQKVSIEDVAYRRCNITLPSFQAAWVHINRETKKLLINSLLETYNLKKFVRNQNLSSEVVFIVLLKTPTTVCTLLCTVYSVVNIHGAIV